MTITFSHHWQKFVFYEKQSNLRYKKSVFSVQMTLLFLRQTTSGCVSFCCLSLTRFRSCCNLNGGNWWLQYCEVAWLFLYRRFSNFSFRVLPHIFSRGEALYVWRRCLWPGWRNSSTKPVRYGDACYCSFITTVVWMWTMFAASGKRNQASGISKIWKAANFKLFHLTVVDCGADSDTVSEHFKLFITLLFHRDKFV